MLVLLGMMALFNVVCVSNAAVSAVSNLTIRTANYVIGKKNTSRVLLLLKLAKIVALRKLGFYNRITNVWLHREDKMTDVTRQAKRIDPVVARSSFLTSSAFFFHEMGLEKDDVLEVHGLDEYGEVFKFVFDWDSKITIPLIENLDNDKLVDTKVCSASAVYGDVNEDITDLVRTWTRCCSVERVLPYIAREYFNNSERLWDAVLMACKDDRFEIHILNCDMTQRKMVYEQPARLLIKL